ncbi:MAG: hypothetical protein Q8P89_04450 [bacterium]|nr:hypothetical protein [bacterium]
MIQIYFTAIFWNFRKVFTQTRWGQILVGLAYLIILAFLFSAFFLLSKSIFLFLYTFREVSQPIVNYLLLSALAFSSLLSVFSFVFSLSQRLFERKLSFYFLSSSSGVSLFQSVFWENFLLGGWPFLILALPLLLAYLSVNQAAIIFYFLLLILLILLILLTESLGAILAIVIRYLFGKASQKVVLIFTLFAFLMIGIVFKQLFLPAGLWEAAQRSTLREVFVGLSLLPVAQPWLPTRLFLESLSANFGAFLIFGLEAAILYFACLLVAKNYYRRSWQKAQEGVFLALPHQKISSPGKAASFHGLWPTLFKKDFLLMDRSPQFMVYFLFVAFLGLIFFFLLSQSPRSPEFSPALFRKVVALAITIIGYLLTMLSLRFAFPGVLSEFRHFWMISCLPKARFKVLLTKWSVNTLLAAVSAWIFGLLAIIFLRLPFDFLPYVLGFSLAAAILISAINLAIGTLWAPQLPRENVDQTTTALPGVLATLFSIFVSVISGVLFYGLVEAEAGGELFLVGTTASSLFLTTALVFSGAFWLLTFLVARQKFTRMDIR